MEPQPHLKDSRGSFWNSVLADLPVLKLAHGVSGKALDQIGSLDARIQLPLEIGDVPSTGRIEIILQAAWAFVLSRHMGSNDVLFFSAIGESVRQLPIRVALPPKRPVEEWLAEFEVWVRQAEASDPIPDEIAAQIKTQRLDHLLTTFCVLHKKEQIPPSLIHSTSPLVVLVHLETASIEIHYVSALFEEHEIFALGHHLNISLHGLIDNPHGLLGTLPILTPEERHQLLTDWNDTAVPFAGNKCIHKFFEEQAMRTPDAIAVVFCDRQWTYRELNDHAEILAKRLKDQGVGPGAFVAVCLSRSLELMAALLAILKAGGAYLPLDPSYPEERLAFMLDDARPTAVIVSKKTENLFQARKEHLLRIEDAEGETNVEGAAQKSSVPIHSSNAAYVLYTSGSTGRPKGVVVTHRNVSNFFTAMDGIIGTESGVWLAVTSINFDISVFELFWTLARGFRVIIQEEGQWVSQSDSIYSLPEQIKRHGVTHLQCTPSLAAMLLCDSKSVDAIKPLRRFIIGGEPLRLDLAQHIAGLIEGELFNLYGPTETTVWSAAERIYGQEKQILIGRPVANNRMYVLDAERELVPVGTVGELYIGGDGVAQGYLHRPDVTTERFVTHTLSPGKSERLYRTGDLVRHTSDGRLEFIGRIDQQIKIRGVRVELGEIEAVLREHPDIRDAVVIAQEDESDDKRLVAYLISSSLEAKSEALLQKWLFSKLPKILVPSFLIFLAEFPKTPNGKLDRRALPKPDSKSSSLRQETGSELERRISEIWCDVLNVKSVGIEERFFDLGGHSLLMVEVHDQLRDKLGHEMALLDLFQYPTIRSLAKHLSERAPVNSRQTTGVNRGKLRQQSAIRSSGSLRRAAFIKRSS
jgi:amino acid adenylation domain-containing protein